MGSRELGLERDAEQAPIKTTAITVEPRTTIGSAHTALAALGPTAEPSPAKSRNCRPMLLRKHGMRKLALS